MAKKGSGKAPAKKTGAKKAGGKKKAMAPKVEKKVGGGAKQAQKSVSKKKQDVEVQSGAVDQNAVLLDKTIELAKDISKNYVTLAENVYRISDKEVFRARGHDNLVEFFQDGLGISKSHGYYLRDIGKMMEIYSVDHDQALRIGWTKLKELTKIITPKNKKDLLERAEKLPVDELQAYVKKIKKSGAGGKPGKPEEYTRMSFKLKDSEWKIIQAAMETAKAEFEGEEFQDNAGFILAHICSEWHSDPAHYDSGPLEDRVKLLEERYGVKIEYNDAEDEDPEDPDADGENYDPGDDDLGGIDEDQQKELDGLLGTASRTNPDLKMIMR